jgi:hypothetical protein
MLLYIYSIKVTEDVSKIKFDFTVKIEGEIIT